MLALHVRVITKIIFSYTGSPGEKISQSFRRASFLTHTVGVLFAFTKSDLMVFIPRKVVMVGVAYGLGQRCCVDLTMLLSVLL